MHRFTRWPDGSTELYDETTDLRGLRNLAALPEHAETLARLGRLLTRNTLRER